MFHRCSIVVCVIAASSSLAGVLTPPVGPVAPTHKTLTEVEPRTAINAVNTPGDADSLFRISQPGSYYLTGPVTGEAGKHGIEIEASDVTIDLSGFGMRGVPGALFGVIVTGLRDNLTVRNGSVSGWPSGGVELGPTQIARGTLIELIHASENGGTGLRCGDSGMILRCTATDNVGTGIVGRGAALIRECRAGGNDLDGMSVGSGGSIQSCTADNNTGDGIQSGSGVSILDCVAEANDEMGIRAGASGGLVSRCSALSNALDGINVAAGVTVRGCNVAVNSGNGIVCTTNALVEGNNIWLQNDPGMAGILLTGADNRVDSNNLSQNTTGVRANPATGNLIVRNTFANNTATSDIVAGNRAAQLITPGANLFVSTDPWANFVY